MGNRPTSINLKQGHTSVDVTPEDKTDQENNQKKIKQ